MKKYAVMVGIGLALVVGGYAAGRYAAPDKVVVTEKVVTVHDVQIVKVVETDKVLDALKNVTQQKNVHKTRVIVKAKDGTVTTTETTDDKSKTDSQTKVQDKQQTKTAETKKELDITERVVTKMVERNRQDWRLTIMPGLDVASALGYGQPYSLLPSSNPMLKYLVVGVGIEHRLVGPLSGGVWANSNGVGGLTLSLEW